MNGWWTSWRISKCHSGEAEDCDGLLNLHVDDLKLDLMFGI